MLNAGIIKKSNASYYSQVTLVSKPDGTYRFCIDYRGLNNATKSASWPIPNIRQLLARLGSKKADMFGVIDLTQGYHQAGLTLSAMPFTAFITHMGTYHFTRLPFGPKRAPSYFQEMMASVVLSGLIYQSCEIYLDDCIIYGTGIDEFCERLEQVFQRFSDKNIFLKAAKTKLGMSTVDYVGKQVSKDGITMSPKKIRGVQDFPMPLKVTELRSFLGLTNYFRDFVPNHSNVVAPLFKIIQHAAKKQDKLVWNDDAANAFENIKSLISRSPMLYFIHDTAPIILMTDASDYGVGGYLYQLIDDKKELVALVSTSLSATQLRWSVIQKEAYAIFYCCTYLDAMLRDRQFTILTDHKNLTYIEKSTDSMVGRWRMALQELDFKTGYIPGKDNSIADAMSRLCINNMPKKTVTVSAIQKSKPLTPEYYEIISKCHNTVVGHGGVNRTMRNLKATVEKWVGMREDVRQFIAHCPCCQKMTQIKTPVNAYRYTTSTYKPMECLNIDFIGPYPDKGYILVIIDTFTRFVELIPCTDATAKSACNGLLSHIGRYGAPKYLRSDNGPQFANKVIEEFLQMVGSIHNLTLAYSSEENAIVERCNKEVNRHIKAYTYDRATTENYQEIIPFVQRIINTTVNERMKVSPSQLLYGNAIDVDTGILLPQDEITINTESMSISSSRMLHAQNELIRITRELLEESDRLHMAGETHDPTEYEVGSFVLVSHRTGPPTRMHTTWRGPMRVVSVSHSEYTLLDLVNNKQTVFSMTQLKPFLFDPSITNPVDVARRDYLEFFIEKVIGMRGDITRYNSLEFHVKWLNYDDTKNSWEPWKNLRCTEQLHKFLIERNLKKLIPRQFRENYPE